MGYGERGFGEWVVGVGQYVDLRCFAGVQSYGVLCDAGERARRGYDAYVQSGVHRVGFGVGLEGDGDDRAGFGVVGDVYAHAAGS